MASSLRSNLSLFSPPTTHHHPSSARPPVTSFIIRCGPRNNRGPLVKGRTLSIEAIQAVQSLKRAHRSDPSDPHLTKTLSRLIKADLIAAFNELLRQDHCELALVVFSVIKSESWYKTELGLYGDLVATLARKGLMEEIDGLIHGLEEEGAIPSDDKGLVRLVKALIAAERTESTVRLYGLMKRSGWDSSSAADEYVADVLARGLRRLGEKEVADEVDVKYGRLSRAILAKNKA